MSFWIRNLFLEKLSRYKIGHLTPKLLGLHSNNFLYIKLIAIYWSKQIVATLFFDAALYHSSTKS